MDQARAGDLGAQGVGEAVDRFGAQRESFEIEDAGGVDPAVEPSLFAGPVGQPLDVCRIGDVAGQIVDWL